MTWSANAEDAKMLFDILSTINNAISEQFVLNLLDTFLDNMLKILRKLLLSPFITWPTHTDRVSRNLIG